MQTVRFDSGDVVPALGMGSWNIGDSTAHRAEEIASLHSGLDQGLRVIDTAEMYGSGRSEHLVGEAIADRRSDVFLVSKVLPSNATREGTIRSCEASLKRLGTGFLDLYLLHWRGGVPLAETVEAFETLVSRGLIRHWGVSNFDTEDMHELEDTSSGCAANQILYNLDARGVDFDLIEHNSAGRVVTMAYSPLGQGGELLNAPVLAEIAREHETRSGPATPAQIALAWTLRKPGILSIPKAGTRRHMQENIAALSITLREEDMTRLNDYFPSPKHKMPLEMI
ncbi:aldo/keto reductase [Asaia bogorensis]|uniref:aldo/keto reductase n=1 Tax=Asaia bogorensis TaxID=91915 RepID=UPI000EFBC2F0|nr:aldo/keto reductase [Asaia bogorensis]